AHDLALLHAELLYVLGGELERLAAVERRAVEVRLHAGVVGLEPAAGGQADGELGVERLDRRVVLHDGERGGWALERLGPESAVQERRAGMVLRGARPLDAAELLEPLEGHPRVHRAERTALVPGGLRRDFTPVIAQAPGKLGQDPDVVARVARRVERLAHALHTPLRARH